MPDHRLFAEFRPLNPTAVRAGRARRLRERVEADYRAELARLDLLLGYAVDPTQWKSPGQEYRSEMLVTTRNETTSGWPDEGGRFECVVVGGGVAGLTTAARLARHGMAVALIEHDLLGSGATTRNHGMLHSGAMYARWHPQIVAACLQAQDAYLESFGKHVSGTEICWYLGTADTIADYTAAWRGHGVEHTPVETAELRRTLAMPEDRTVVAYAVRELFIDTSAMIADLASRCLGDGVEILVGSRVSRVAAADGRVRGVQTATGFVEARNVVLCSGIGTRAVLERSGSVVAGELSSRLETMFAAPGRLAQAVIGLEFGWPALAPSAAGDAVLASWYGSPQRFVTGPARWPVPVADMADLGGELAGWLPAGTLDWRRGAGWVCGKTEHRRGGGDQWGTEPDFAVVDHGARDGVDGWWTVLPGKMTLALHASRAVAAAVTGVRQPLALPAGPDGHAADVTGLVDVSPWAAHRQAGGAR